MYIGLVQICIIPKEQLMFSICVVGKLQEIIITFYAFLEKTCVSDGSIIIIFKFYDFWFSSPGGQYWCWKPSGTAGERHTLSRRILENMSAGSSVELTCCKNKTTSFSFKDRCHSCRDLHMSQKSIVSRAKSWVKKRLLHLGAVVLFSPVGLALLAVWQACSILMTLASHMFYYQMKAIWAVENMLLIYEFIIR